MKNFPIGIGALSHKTGSSPETIRYYEQQGMLTSPQRTEGGHRQYQLDHLRRLIFILRARELGFSQADVKALLRLADQPNAPCSEVQHIAESHLVKIRHKLDGLRSMEAVLADMVNSCLIEGTSGHCPIVDTLNQTVEIGSPEL